MSQIYKPLTSSGPIPPVIPTSFETDDGTAIPSANVLEVFAYDSEEDNVNGITTKGGLNAGDPPDAGNGDTNEVGIYLTNRITGAEVTTDDTVTQIFSFDLGGVAGTYLMKNYIVAYDVNNNKSAAYSSQINVRTNGVTANAVSSGNHFTSEEDTMVNCSVQSGTTGNTFILTVTGLPATTINWRALTEYIFTGVI